MSSWQSDTIEVNGIQLHYTRTGAGAGSKGRAAKPPIVLAHGVTDDGLCWTPVAEALAPEYDVIMVDARGHGRSAAPEHGYGPAEQANDLHGVIAALGLQRPVVLGHSMGAVTTLVLAGTYPEVPRAILLEDPPGWWLNDSEGSPGEMERQAAMRAWIRELKGKTREELIAEQRKAAPGWSEVEIGSWADAKLRLSLNVLNIFDPSTPTSVNWPAILGRIRCPALLIKADPTRGAILTQDGAAALQKLVPQLQIVHVPEAGHNIRRDQFDRFMTAVRAFLAASTAPA
jgi:N-formylmaleamate deformylase